MAADPYRILQSIALREEHTGILTFVQGSYFMVAQGADNLVHWGILSMENEVRLFYPCAIGTLDASVDGRDAVLPCLRDAEEPVTCLLCVAHGPWISP